MDATYVDFTLHPAKGSALVALEVEKQVPFQVARIYYVYGDASGAGGTKLGADAGGDAVLAGDASAGAFALHGQHAHRRGRQVVVCLRGRCRVHLDDGKSRAEFLLDRPDRGLHLGPMLWEEFWLSTDGLLLALCDLPYDAADQIADRDEFQALVSATVAQPSAPTESAPPARPAPELPFLDLKRVNARYEPALTLALAKVREQGLYVGGPQVAEFEAAFAAYCGTRHCVGLGNGYDALRLLLRASGLSLGDEVLVPANTFIASILAVLDAGLSPVLMEPDPSTFLLDPETVAAALTPRTRAVLAVHLYGCCAGIDVLREMAERHGLLLFEDAAQAHGAAWAGIKAGAWGKAAAFSFYPTKNLGALGDAGAVTTDDDCLAADLRALRNYGGETRELHRLLGANSRLDALQAAALLAKLPYLDQDNARRREIAHAYLERIQHPQVRLPARPPEPEAHVWHLFVVRSARRDALRAHLAERGIGTAVHYPTPPHQEPALAILGQEPALARLGQRSSPSDLSLPVTEQLAREVLSLPLHPALTEAEVERVIDAVNSFPSA